MIRLLVNHSRIATETRSGIAFHYIESEGYSDALKHELACKLAGIALDALMRDEWARAVLVSDQHDGGIGISIGDGRDSPITEIVRICPSWPKEHAAAVILKYLGSVPIYRNPQ